MKRFLILSLLVVLAMSGCVQGTPRNKLTASKENKATSQAGDTDSEISNLKAALESNPNNGNKWFALGSAYSKNKQYQEAIDAFKKSFGPDKTNPAAEWAVWTHIRVAHEALGQVDSAISAQKRAIELNPENADLYAALAHLYYDNKQYDETIATAKRAVELRADQAVAYNYLGAAYAAKKQYPEAVRAVRRSIELIPKDPNNYGLLGNIYLDQDSYEEAIAAFAKGIVIAPNIPSLYDRLALSYYNLGRYDEAIAPINTAIDLLTIPGGLGIGFLIKDGFPNINEVMNTSPAKSAGIEVGDKITEIEGVTTRDLDSETVVQQLKGPLGTQVVLTIERNGALSKKSMTRDKILSTGTAAYIGRRSLIYRHKGDLNKAFDDARLALVVDPSQSRANLAAGAAYLDREQYAEATKRLSQVKDSPTARLLEATAYARQGKMPEAIDVYSSINFMSMSVKTIPQMNDRKSLSLAFKPFIQEHRDAARLLQSKGQYREALSELSEALKASDGGEAREVLTESFALVRKSPALGQIPDEARKYAIRSEVLVKQGNFADGASEIQKAIKAAPYIGQLYYNAAFIYAEMKQYHEAIHQMTIYLSASPDSPHASAGKDEIIRWELMIEKGK